MAIYLTESDVTGLLTMEMALGAVEGVFLRQAQGGASNLPRRRVRSAGTTLHVMSGADGDWMGLKSYTVTREGARFFINLYRAQTGELVALIEADRLGQMRTGAASGVATKYLARQGAATVGIYGTGWQARSQLAAVCAVRPIERVLVYSRDPGNRERFCREMGDELGISSIEPVAHPEEAAAASIIITITTAREPVLRGEWIQAGAHLNAAGGNSLLRREFDDRAIERSSLLTVDSLDQARLEAGELVTAVEKGLLNWERVVELRQIVAGEHSGRRNGDEITIFKSLGLAIEDIATAALVYEVARQQQRGREI
jgi:alanine dehydrogenase